MKIFKALLCLLMLISPGQVLAQDDDLQPYRPTEKEAIRNGYEVLVVEIAGPQAQDGTNNSPPSVNMKVVQVGTLEAKPPLPYTGEMFRFGATKPNVGDPLNGVIWSTDHFSQPEEHEARMAWPNDTLKAPAVGSKWIVMLKQNDENHLETHGKFRREYGREMFGWYVRQIEEVAKESSD